MTLAAAFPSHHGFVHLHSLPAPRSLAPPSDRLSVLRGLSASSSRETGLGENNLAFKCTRRRIVIETLHLDVEGGVGERRTTPGDLTIAHSDALRATPNPSNTGGPSVVISAEPQMSEQTKPVETVAPKKAKKKVGFVSERPEVYDF